MDRGRNFRDWHLSIEIPEEERLSFLRVGRTAGLPYEIRRMSLQEGEYNGRREFAYPGGLR